MSFAVPDNGPFGPEEFARIAAVSRETLGLVERYVALLEDWNGRHNLVSQGSMADLWRRHLWDSAQLAPLIPRDASFLADLGSGAGLPGIVLAILLREHPTRFALYEATQKKCAFLNAVVTELGLHAEVRCARIEIAAPDRFDVIVARALAPMETLLGYAFRFWQPNTVGLFLKGQSVGEELTKACESWKMTVKKHQSRSDERGAIVEVRELRRASTS